MAHTQYLDELVREYLLYRGFSNTLKMFDNELKADKDKGFRVDKIMDQLLAYITSYDLNSLRELWAHLDQRIFCRLEDSFRPAVRKLENAILKMYLVTAVQTGKHEKVMEFFEKVTSDLQGQSEWKEWFVLPFTKNPEENVVFAVYFTRQWQDTTLVSLHNFLAIIFQCMPQPTLASYDEDAAKIKKLQEENEALKNKLSRLTEGAGPKQLSDLSTPDVPMPTNELMDDFYVIAQETPAAESQIKTFKNLIRNIGSNIGGGLPTSPILGRKAQPTSTSSHKRISVSSGEEKPKSRSSGGSQSSGYGGLKVSEHGAVKKVVQHTSSSSSLAMEMMVAEGNSIKSSIPETEGHSPYLLLSQEEYSEHRVAITQLKFNTSGSIVISADLGGVIKIWSPTPSLKTLATCVNKAPVVALDWASKNERYFIHGNKDGTVRLYDIRERKIVWELVLDPTTPFRRILTLCCNPAETNFVCSVVRRSLSVQSTEAPQMPMGKLHLYDLKTRRLEKTLSTSSPSVANCLIFNHNGQLLLAGTNDGRISIVDMNKFELIASWAAHDGEILSLQLSVDETSCFSLGEDAKLCEWNVNHTGQKVSEAVLHEGMSGPFWLSSGNAGSSGSSNSASSSQPLKFHPYGRLFSFDADGRKILTCAPHGGIIYELSGSTLQQLMCLGGHQMPVVAVDWSSVNQCFTCVTGSLDGRIRISTLLSQ